MDAELVTGIAPRTLPLPLRLLGDERLARLVGSGHEEAFTILYQRHHQALYRYCRSLVGTDADAQDALQSAMTGALLALRVSRRDAPIRPWLFRIVHNEAMSQLRRRRPVAELAEDLPALDPTPEGAAEQRARLAGLLDDLRQLPERQRGALVMRELSGLSHQEVAEALGVSVGAAKQMVFEARRSLQEFDEGRAMACEDVRRLISDGDGRSLRGRRVRAHLRDCGGCAVFAAAIPQRRADLRAVAPVLPAGAAAGLLVRITGAGSSQGGGGSAGLLGGVTGKAVVAGVSSKLLATGAIIVATAAVGTGGIVGAISHSTPATHLGGATTRATGAGGAAGPAHHGSATSSGRAGGHRLHRASGSAAGKGHSHHLRSGAPGASGRGSTNSHRGATGRGHGHGGSGQGAAKSAAGGARGRHLGTHKPPHQNSGAGSQQPRPTHPSHPTTSQAPAHPASSGSPHQGNASTGPLSQSSSGPGSGGAGGAKSKASSLLGSASGSAVATP